MFTLPCLFPPSSPLPSFPFCSTGAWTQGLPLERLCQLFSCDGFFWDRVLQTICPGWLWATILLVSASWVARITGVSHRCPALFFFFSVFVCLMG
jgi:hypothetical protein